jgi:hypothetical protein
VALEDLNINDSEELEAVLGGRDEFEDSPNGLGISLHVILRL